MLSKLRKSRDPTQKELADLMEIRQASVLKLEQQDDIMVGTLEEYVKALRGELEIRMTFSYETVTIRQFSTKAA